MSNAIVVSDLHLGDGDPDRDQWRVDQQAAWERLLRAAAPGGELGDGRVELIVNGDSFDFLEAAPTLDDRTHTDADAGLAKVERIIAAHSQWFAAMRAFLAAPDRSVTFLIGNHDLELAFPAVRSRIRAAAMGSAGHSAGGAGRVRFCLAQAYRPLPDVVIEHGCQVDPPNRIPSLWTGPDASAIPADLEADDVSPVAAPSWRDLPWGSRYYYDVLLPILRRFPYLEALLPSLPQSGVAGLLCRYVPDLVVAGVPRARALRDDPPDDPPDAPPADRARPPAAGDDPATLYAATLPDLVATQAMLLRRAGLTSPDPADAARADAYTRAIHTALAGGDELALLRAVFSLPRAPSGALPSLDAAAAALMVERDPAARVALIGHTHVEGLYTVPRPDGEHVTFINTGTWVSRLAAPDPATIDARTARWLRDPRAGPTPLTSAAIFAYAILRGRPGAPTVASLHAVGDPAGPA
jgi:hypothetical protein